MRLLPAFLDDAMHHAFLTQLLSTPKGRATLLMQLAEAEGGDGGELDIFQHLLAVLEDDEAKKLARAHKEDEERHEQLFAAAARKEGAEPVRHPKESQLLRRLDAHTGFFSKPITQRDGVVEAYLLLLVIEERALRQFALMKKAFAAVGAHDIAVLFDEVAADEERHLRYCEAISRRYSTDEVQRQARLAELRALEARCFEEVQIMNGKTLIQAGLLEQRGAWGMLWRGLARVADARVRPLPMAQPVAAHA
jgi:rubrerythrin